MGRVLLMLVVGVPFLAIGAALGAMFGGRWTGSSLGAGGSASDREMDFRERMAVLQHHTDLLERSRRASVDGDHGLANIYAEAAERVLRLTEQGPALPDD